MRPLLHTLRREVMGTLALFIAMGPVAAADVLPDTELAIPRGKGVTVNWVVPTNAAKPRRTPDHFVFAVDGHGQPWFGFDHKVLVNTLKMFVLRASMPYTDFTWLDTDEIVACTSNQVGVFGPPDFGEENSIPVARFRPALTLPEKTWRVFAGRNRSFYLVGSDRWGRDAEVYALRSQEGRPRIEKIFASGRAVASVSGDGKETFVAVDRLILKLAPGGTAQGIFRHSEEDITGLESLPDGELFYSTRKGVGYIGPHGRYEFFKTPDPQIRARGDSLYVLLGESYGVVRIDGIRAFRNLETASLTQPAAQPVVEKKAGPPARVEKPLPPVEDEVFCPKCRMVNDPGTKVCTNCGAKLKP